MLYWMENLVSLIIKWMKMTRKIMTKAMEMKGSCFPCHKPDILTVNVLFLEKNERRKTNTQKDDFVA